MEVDIIEFKVPYENNKTLFVWGIQPTFTEAFIYESVSNVFSAFGPLYLLKVCPNAAVAEPGFYALVKFFSAAQASKAQAATHGRGLFQTTPLKVRLSTKHLPSFLSHPSSHKPLSHSKCLDLANVYLGFNGWSTRIITLKDLSSGTDQEGLPERAPGLPERAPGQPDRAPGQPDRAPALPGRAPGLLDRAPGLLGRAPGLPERAPGLADRAAGSSHEESLRYGCMVEITFPKHQLSCRGVGVAEETFDVTSPEVALQKRGKLQKWAKENAVVQAFEKVLLLVLDNGKVAVEVRVDRDEVLPDQHPEGVIQVNDVPWSQFDPEELEEEELWDLTVNM